MKKRIVLCIVLIILSFSAFSQNYKITYEFDVSKIEKSIREKLTPKKRASSLILPAIPYLKRYQPVLWINGDESSYITTKILGNDADNSLSVKIAETFSHVNDAPVYQNLKSQRSLKTIETLGEKFLVEYPFHDLNWKITEKTKTIKGLKCLKATTRLKQNPNKGKKRYLEIEAWFAPSIPLPFGPNGYGGLPGLIVELSRNNLYV